MTTKEEVIAAVDVLWNLSGDSLLCVRDPDIFALGYDARYTAYQMIMHYLATIQPKGDNMRVCCVCDNADVYVDVYDSNTIVYNGKDIKSNIAPPKYYCEKHFNTMVWNKDTPQAT